MPGLTKSCTCHAKSSLQTCRSAPKYKLSQESSALPPNISDEHISCIVPATRNASFQVPFRCPTLAIVSGTAINPLTFSSLLARCRIRCLRLPHKTTLQRPKVARTCGVLHVLTSKCASRHNSMHIFNISTSKSAPRLRCFVYFDFEMCSAPQQHALFQHLNFQ